MSDWGVRVASQLFKCAGAIREAQLSARVYFLGLTRGFAFSTYESPSSAAAAAAAAVAAAAVAAAAAAAAVRLSPLLCCCDALVSALACPKQVAMR